MSTADKTGSGGRSTVPGKVASALTETPGGGRPSRPSPLRPEPDRAGAVRLCVAFGAKHVRECFGLAVFSEEPRLPVHHREVPGRQGGEARARTSSGEGWSRSPRGGCSWSRGSASAPPRGAGACTPWSPRCGRPCASEDRRASTRGTDRQEGPPLPYARG